jgi:ribonuclease HII
LYQKTIIKGDQLCLSIAAASIVAKVARDQIMVEFDKEYPEYGFAGHKGYGSAAHVEALRRHGPSPIHRQSFKPVRDAAAER